MILQLGGINGIRILAQEGIIQLLGKMSSNGILSKLFQRISDLQNLLKREGYQTAEDEVEAFVRYLEEIQLQLDGDEKSLSEKFVKDEIQRIVNRIGYKIKGEADRIHQQLIDAKVFQLGIELQCPVCTKHSWHSVKGADYELQCSECLTHFSFPPSSKEVKWAYRTLGPFSSANQADGAYTVLLTLRFFSHLLLLGGATTPLMSFTAQKKQMKLEADLALFFQVPGLVNPNYELIFAECKTFNDFQKRDVDRMKDLGKEFPDAVLVFATLKGDLSDNEKKILFPMVNDSRKNWMSGNPFNPVLILTGTELFWQSDLSEWKQKMERKIRFIRYPNAPRSELLVLCDFTQQVYLNITP